MHSDWQPIDINRPSNETPAQLLQWTHAYLGVCWWRDANDDDAGLSRVWRWGVVLCHANAWQIVARRAPSSSIVSVCVLVP